MQQDFDELPTTGKPVLGAGVGLKAKTLPCTSWSGPSPLRNHPFIARHVCSLLLREGGPWAQAVGQKCPSWSCCLGPASAWGHLPAWEGQCDKQTLSAVVWDTKLGLIWFQIPAVEWGIAAY